MQLRTKEDALRISNESSLRLPVTALSVWHGALILCKSQVKSNQCDTTASQSLIGGRKSPS